MFTELLLRLFIKNYRDPSNPRTRLACGTLAGAVGVAVNVLLFGVKFTLGLLTGSLAVSADAVNNLSDASSSLVTLAGFRLAAKPADAEHPFGHGRSEYIAGVVAAVVIIAVGLNFLKESFFRILQPEEVRCSTSALAVLAASMLLKVWLFLFYRAIGRKIDSRTISAAGFDSLSDLISTAVALGAMVWSRFSDFPADGVAGVLVALFVLWGGIGILREAINPLLGTRPKQELVAELERRLRECPGIRGVHDIILHCYGPNLYFATAHAEVDRDGDLVDVHDTLEAAEVEIGRTMPIRLILHCDPFEVADPVVKMWRARMENAVSAIDAKLKLYDFRLEEPSDGRPRRLHFHLLIPRVYGYSQSELTHLLLEAMRKYDPGIEIAIDFINAFV